MGRNASQSNMPEITVAITAHNLEHCIVSCCEELFAQTYQNFHIVIYDDCSTDATRDILSEIHEQHPEKMTLILGKTLLGGPALSRNAILDSGAVNGKYIVFLDGDDKIEADFLEKLHTAAQTYQADISLCAYDRVEMLSGHVLCQEMRGFPSVIELPTCDPVLAYINGSLWNKLIRVDVIQEARLPQFKAGEDLSFLWALYPRCKRIACVDEMLIHYQVRGTSVISNMQVETVYAFSNELYRLWKNTQSDWYRDTLMLVVFIHIGISMISRVADNPQNNTNAVIRQISAEFCQRYNWFRDCTALKLKALLPFGIKGLGLLAAKICYRIGCFPVFIFLYKFVTRTLHIDIKF